ncbi:MAG: hypothetical protein RIR00_809 [Pseudomonadota bacterium]|jgi:hypothetical protein
MSVPHPALLILLLALALPVAAGEGDAAKAADRQARLANAEALEQQGRAEQAAVEQSYQAEKTACHAELLVTHCQSKARDRYVAAIRPARDKENRAHAMVLQIRQEERDERLQDKAGRQEAEDADLAVRRGDAEAAASAAEARRAARLAEKEAQAEAGARKRQASDEAHARKQAEHERKVAEQIRRHQAGQAAAGR